MKKILLFIAFFCYGYHVHASHLRAGEIRVEQVNCNTQLYKVTLVLYINFINTGVRAGGGPLSFGDGTSTVVPEFAGYEVIDAELGIGRIQYTDVHEYKSLGTYIITYR